MVNEVLSPEAQAYADKLWPCQPPCDSYGVCENCCERTLFHAGYNFGCRAQREKDAKICSDVEMEGFLAGVPQPGAMSARILIERQ